MTRPSGATGMPGPVPGPVLGVLLAVALAVLVLVPPARPTGAFFRAQATVTGVSVTSGRLVDPAPVCVPPSGLLTVPHLEWTVPSPAPSHYVVRYSTRGGGPSGSYDVTTSHADVPVELLRLAGTYDFVVLSRLGGWTSAASSAVTVTVSQVAGLGLAARCGN